MKGNLSQIGLGTWQFSMGKGEIGSFWPKLGQQVVTDIVKTSLDSGVNWFDTAEKYGDGESERVLTGALKSLGIQPEEVIIADKWWPKKRKAKSLVDTIDERLEALNGFPIGLYQIHWPESESSLYSEMKHLAKLVKLGKVQSVGLCNYNWRQVWLAHKFLSMRGVKLASVQVRYNLAYRSIEGNNLLKLAEDLDFKIIAWSPLESGLLTGKFHDDEQLLGSIAVQRNAMYGFSKGALERTRSLVTELKNIAATHGVEASQVALAWIRQQHKGRVLTIPGASSPVQAKLNADSMNLCLSSDELSLIDEQSMNASIIA